MRIILNGESKELSEGMNLQAMLEAEGIEARRVAVERSGEIVPKSCYAQTLLAEGDQIEVFGFIGGG